MSEPNPTGPGSSTPASAPGRRRFQSTDTGRVEAFSDAVLAIAITILALEMSSPEHEPGGLLPALLHQWPVYLGYLTSFAYIGVIWLNHHQAFTRIRVVDRGLHVANLALLFTTAALPFPTGVLSEALQENLSSADARPAVALYALIARRCVPAGSGSTSTSCGIRARSLSGASPTTCGTARLRSGAGLVTYVLAGSLGYLVTPVIALVIFLGLPVFYFLTSEGLPRGRAARP